MCGIFALLNNNKLDENIINNEFMKGKHRGPESSKFNQYNKMYLGFHRLAINGLNDLANQPLEINDIILICNGEIYNYKYLYNYIDVEPITESDCEVIIHLYLKYGIEQTLTMLDGVYSFILLDNRINNDITNYLYIARDPLGIRPLYKLTNITYLYNKFSEMNINNNFSKYAKNKDNLINKNLIGFSSELKMLEYFYNIDISNYNVEQFEPGTYSIYKLSYKINSIWKPYIENKKYYIPNAPIIYFHKLLNKNISITDLDNYNNLFNYYDIANNLVLAVEKRCLSTERPIACLLSGGLDSSLISALVSDYFRNEEKQINTYSIGLKGSTDLKYSKIVAEYIGSNHHEIIISEDEIFEIIPDVIKAIESYDITTIRASIGNYLIAKYISENSDAKVIFNGDGSDELFGGYLYMHNCKNNIEFDKETRRLLKDIYLFDVLRSDKCISAHGLEARTPFLDKNFVNYILSIPMNYRNHNNFNLNEKYLLRNSFSIDRYKDSLNRQILPDNILYRKKEAFSDGVSSLERSLFIILQEKIAEKMYNDKGIKYPINIDTEKEYYLNIFNNYFKNCEHILPYYWMPKYSNTNDPSARTLDVYKVL
jgi:asparagine synthase (glutamine-hydrolysing)